MTQSPPGVWEMLTKLARADKKPGEALETSLERVKQSDTGKKILTDPKIHELLRNGEKPGSRQIAIQLFGDDCTPSEKKFAAMAHEEYLAQGSRNRETLHMVFARLWKSPETAELRKAILAERRREREATPY